MHSLTDRGRHTQRMWDTPDIEELDATATAAASEEAQCHVGCSFVLRVGRGRRGSPNLARRKRKAWDDS
jgi:hypothetical protein